MNEAIGPGRLVLVVGPSGAGKDTLIALARAALRAEKGFVFPRRAVTRPSSSAEDHDSVTEREFELALENGGFALAWDAHGLKYGIPVSIDDELRAARTVVCNVSRGVVDFARSRYARVVAVQVTAPAETLRQRLSTRERESGGAIDKRLARGGALAESAKPDFVIDNSGRPEISARKLVAIIRSGQPAASFPSELLF